VSLPIVNNFPINDPDTHDHAIIGPSGFKKTANCPGHLWLCRDIQEEKSSYATEGDKFHKWMDHYSRGVTLDRWDVQMHEPILRTVANNLSKMHITEFRLTPEYDMAQNVINSLDLLYNIEQHLLANRNNHRKPRRFIEEKVILNEYQFGTLDYGFAVLRNKGWEGVILDHKYGQGVPVRFDETQYKGVWLNWQLGIYGVGFIRMVKERLDIDLDYIYMYVNQPRTAGKAWEATHCAADLLNEWYDEVVMPLLERGAQCYQSVEHPGDEYFQAGDWCHKGFCKARPKCVYYKRLTDETLAADVGMTSLDLPSPSKLTSEQLVNIYRHEDSVRNFLKEVREYVEKSMDQGVHYEGLKRVTKLGNSTWRKDLTQDEIADGLRKLGAKDPFVRKLPGISDAKKLVDKDKKDLVTELIQRPEKVVVVLDTDIRDTIESVEFISLPTD
jgi:hypothetical protein